MAKKKSKRNIAGLRNQPKSTPHIESMNAVPNSGSPRVSNEQTDSADEEEWCPNSIPAAKHAALFVFDQSSAHAALPSDALKAFEMNKSNGGAQRRQKDTIIPNSNAFPEHRGLVQKMTTENGKQKGLDDSVRKRDKSAAIED
jgi:hypothetical protein